jgi:hypothetical protein
MLPVVRQVQEVLKEALVPFEPAILFSRIWRQRLRPFLAAMPEMKQEKQQGSTVKGAIIADVLYLPEAVTPTGDTVVIANRIVFKGQHTVIKGPYGVHCFAVESMGTVGGRGGDENLVGNGRPATLTMTDPNDAYVYTITSRGGDGGRGSSSGYGGPGGSGGDTGRYGIGGSAVGCGTSNSGHPGQAGNNGSYGAPGDPGHPGQPGQSGSINWIPSGGDMGGGDMVLESGGNNGYCTQWYWVHYQCDCYYLNKNAVRDHVLKAAYHSPLWRNHTRPVEPAECSCFETYRESAGCW